MKHSNNEHNIRRKKKTKMKDNKTVICCITFSSNKIVSVKMHLTSFAEANVDFHLENFC